MTSEQILAIGTIIGTSLWTVYRLWKKASEAQAQSRTTKDETSALREEFTRLRLENAQLTGRVAEQRIIYQSNLDSLQKELSSLKQAIFIKEQREQKLIQALRAEQQKSQHQAEEIQALRKRITELEEQLGFMMKLKAAND